MAIDKIIDAVTDEVDYDTAVAAAFTLEEQTVIRSNGLAVGEIAMILILSAASTYVPLTNKEGAVYLSVFPNTVLLEPGTYAITKDESAAAVTIGHGE